MTPDKPLSLTWTPSLLKRTAVSLAVHAGQMWEADVGGRWGHYGCSPGNLLASAIHITREPVGLTGPALTEEACHWLVMHSVNTEICSGRFIDGSKIQPSTAQSHPPTKNVIDLLISYQISFLRWLYFYSFKNAFISKCNLNFLNAFALNRFYRVHSVAACGLRFSQHPRHFT